MGSLRILSDSDAAFEDRFEAGRLLAEELGHLRGTDTVVVGIARGGLQVASAVAEALDLPMDISLAHKLGAPGNPEFAVGAVSEDGEMFVDEYNATAAGADPEYLDGERSRMMTEIYRRAQLYRSVRPKLPLKGRQVVIVDDGLATGSTMLAALWAARKEGPSRLIAAVPVAPPQSAEAVSKHADETVCLRAPQFFQAVGNFYLRFSQVSDEELLELLRKEAQRKLPR